MLDAIWMTLELLKTRNVENSVPHFPLFSYSPGLTKQGVSVDDDTPINGKIMLGTSLSYFIVQGIAFAYVYDPTGSSSSFHC